MTFLLALLAQAEIDAVWLTHASSDPSRIVVNWASGTPGESRVEYGPGPELGNVSRLDGARILHHVEIPMPPAGGRWHYRAVSGSERSAVAVLRGYPEDALRVAVVANWHARPDLPGLKSDDIHLLLTAGDNVPKLWPSEDPATNARPYLDLVRRYRELFATTPFMPITGNHDREIAPRGDRPPADPVYDVEAKAFRAAFALPGEETRWHLDLPGFGVRFIGLDLHHTRDVGTTWQSCAVYGPDSPQLRELRERMAGAPGRFVVTLHNEKQSVMRRLAGGAWHQEISKGTLAVSGFGYFAERAEPEGFPSYTTSLGGRGAKYPDPKSAFFESEDNYLLLSFRRGAPELLVEIKALDGRSLDRRAWKGR